MPAFVKRKKSLLFIAADSGLSVFLVGLLCVFSILGCGDNQKKNNGGEKVTLVFWNTMEGPEARVMPELIKEFEENNPDIKIESKYIDFYKAREKFKESIKSGAGPDLMRADRFWLPGFVAQSAIAEINPESIKEEIEDMVPIAQGVVTLNGKYWAIPISVDCLAMFYNKQHFKEKGLKVPQNFDEFTEAAEKLTDSSKGRYGFFIYPNGWYFEPFFFGFGGQYFAPSGELAINSDHAKKAMQYLLHLKDNLHAVPPVSLRSNIYQTMISSFKNGQVSMIFTGPWAIRSIIEGQAFKDDNSNLGIAPIPEGPHGTFSPTGCQTIVISKNSKHYDQALKFARFMFSVDVQKRLSIVNFGLPARKTVFAAPELKRDPYLQTFIRQLQMNRKVINSPLRGEIYRPLGEKLKKVLNGDLTPEYALNDFQAEWKAKYPSRGD
ncbi:MAG: maltose/maltodextrin ABC transporter substrate-binding protein MalE [Candidatus Rifleibacteriota bacterium]